MHKACRQQSSSKQFALSPFLHFHIPLFDTILPADITKYNIYISYIPQPSVFPSAFNPFSSSSKALLLPSKAAHSPIPAPCNATTNPPPTPCRTLTNSPLNSFIPCSPPTHLVPSPSHDPSVHPRRQKHQLLQTGLHVRLVIAGIGPASGRGGMRHLARGS